MQIHWSKRLRAALTHKGWDVPELARRSGIDEQRIYKCIQGKVDNPRGDVQSKLATALGLRVGWLKFGEAPPPPWWSSEGLGESAQQYVAQPTAAVPIGGVKPIPVVTLSELSKLRTPGDLSGLLRDREVMNVPDVVGPRAIVVRIDDSTMEEDGIPQGSLVICDPDQQPAAGDYAFALSHAMKRAVVRRVRALSPDNKKLELIAQNKFLSPIELSGSKDGFIVGKAAGIWKKL